ncbi:MAG TPA: hypothetical protein VIJ79_07290 [Acidobacteriaceae bacterium]
MSDAKVAQELRDELSFALKIIINQQRELEQLRNTLKLTRDQVADLRGTCGPGVAGMIDDSP